MNQSPDPKDSPPPDPARKSGDPVKKEGWLDNLAKRSTGLPENVSQPDKESSSDTSLWKLAGLGLQFGVTICIFTFVGYELDKKTGWTPWLTVSFSMLAVIGSLYLLIKEAISPPPRPPKAPKK